MKTFIFRNDNRKKLQNLKNWDGINSQCCSIFFSEALQDSSPH